MSESDLDPFVSCPYEAVHRVPLSRLQKHITKCEKNYPTYQICPYNATHRYPPELIKTHVQTCPSKAIVFPEDYSKSSGGSISKPKPILQREYLKKDDPDYEEWDN